jgi:pimeloyl-ACP methyl ester carboxylesterase
MEDFSDSGAALVQHVRHGAASFPHDRYQWHHLAGGSQRHSLERAKIKQPCHLMVGSRDPALAILADAFANLEENVADLRGNIVLDGAGHWLPLERTTEVNSALLAFLRGLDMP